MLQEDISIRVKITLAILSMIVFIGRCTIHGHKLSTEGTYEAFAHIFVGILIAFVILDKYRRYCFFLLVFLTIFETIMFFVQNS